MGKRERRRVVTGAGAHETRLGPGAAEGSPAAMEGDDGLCAAGPPQPGAEGVEADGGSVAAEATPEITPSRRRLTALSGDAATVSLVAPGQVLNDHYRLVREIARGGMGIVFEAEDVKILGRRVAVKVLPPEVAKDRSAVLRLQREASAVCLLDHPGIVRLIELNADGDTHYLVMEYLNGEDLAFHLASNERLHLDEVLDVARQVCPALVYAHDKGVLHRDIKPANLMFKVDGDHRHVKITDFGIASQVKDSMTRLTGQESAGTLLYIAPEQLRGKKPTAAADQYSLAATLYELLSGEPPFTGGGLSHQILEARPEPLTGVPAHVNVALMRAMAKEPEGRFADCGEFLAALEGRSAAAVAARDGAVGAGARPAAPGAAASGGGRSQGAEPAASGRSGSRLVVAALALVALVVVAWGLGFRGGSGPALGPVVVAPTVSPTVRPVVSKAPTSTPTRPATAVPAVAQVGDTWTNSIGMKFSWCPSGEFDMGSPADELGREEWEGPVHRVRIPGGFWLGTHEVTQGQWQAVMGATPVAFAGDDRRPVEQVSWNDCQEFVGKLAARDGNGYRLPSEAEWEYACRAGTTGARYGDLDAVGWYDKNSGSTTHAVGGKRPNAWGMCDMLGNVWEWCQDTWHVSHAGAPADGSAWDGGGGNRVTRGGSWGSGAGLVRAAARDRGAPGGRYHSIGVRLVAAPRAVGSAGGPPVVATPSAVARTPVVEPTISAAPTPAPTPEPTPSPVPTPTPTPTPDSTPSPVPRTVRVDFESDPTGAKVYCVEVPPERKYVGRTGEGPVAVDLEPGTWTFKFILAGYRDGIRTVEVVAGGRPQTVRETLVDQHGFIDVTVVPVDVAVTLDGKPVVVNGGRGLLRAAPGRHTVAARGEGYEDAAETVSVADGATVSSRLVLREKPKGPTPVPVSGRVGETWTNSVGMQFSWCPPGEFDMGGSVGEAYPDEKPVHRVRIPRGFWMATHEVTQGQWQAVMGSNPANFKGDDRRPVEQVSWNDCQEFVGKLAARDGNGYRLPSEAEWEYACRAGTTGARYGDLDAVGWYDKNSGSTTHAVGGKRPNAWGLYDMLGNVFEWCQDTWNSGYSGAPTDGSAWDGGSGNRVLRGGSWRFNARSARAACRYNLVPVSRNVNFGLRVIVLPRTVGEVGGQPPVQTAGQSVQNPIGFIEVTVEPADAVVTLDGTPQTLSGGRGTLRVKPGSHRLAASCEGFESASETVSVADGATVSSRLVLREKPKGPPPVPVSGRVGETWTNSIGMKFSWCPPGEFDMGGADGDAARDEKPVHRVNISRGFWLGTYEVTQGQWREVMGLNPAKNQGGDLFPVEQVSWHDCQEFLRRLAARDGNGYRLPSEAEWEYACRAGTTGARYGDLDAVAWYVRNSGRTTHTVGGKRPNPWGLYDTLGNVWEWCQDTDHRSYSGAPTDGSAWEGEPGGRSLRGGACNLAGGCARAAFRSAGIPDGRNTAFGVRVVALPRVR